MRVHTLLREGEKERTQIYEGIVTAITGSGLGKTFAVRHLVGGIGVERIFPMFSPLITQVDVVRATKVRRARLTYLRKSAVQKRRKEDASLMKKVEAEREVAKRAKEEVERKAHQVRTEAEKIAKDAAAQNAVEEGAQKMEGSVTETEAKRAE